MFINRKPKAQSEARPEVPGNSPETPFEELARRVWNLEKQMKQVVVPNVDGLRSQVEKLEERCNG